MKLLLTIGAALFFACMPADVRAADWPQFRYDAGRGAATDYGLPAELHQQWTRILPAPRPAFPWEERLRYDASYEPVVLGKAMFVPSMVTDSVTAMETDTGEVRWQFFADGPIRFAPVAWQGKIYFGSDDGYLYCVKAGDGTLLWKFRAAPENKKERKLLGNKRLISLWPVRGAPVLADGVIYFAAGLWPADGVFVFSLDAESGETLWSNTTSDSIPNANMDHGVSQHAGITPQGYLALVSGRLVVPCGAQLPAFLDPNTGELGAYNMGWGGRVGLPKGSWFVAGAGNHLTHSGDLYDITRPNDEVITGEQPRFKRMLYPGGFTRFAIDPRNQRALGAFRKPVITKEAMYYNDETGSIVAYDLADYKLVERGKTKTAPVRAEDQYPDKWKAELRRQWGLSSKLKVHIKAGSRLYVGGKDVVQAIEVPNPGEQPQVAWTAAIEGTPHRMLAADDKLFVVTVAGRIYAFGEKKPETAVVHELPKPIAPATDPWTQRADDILKAADAKEGYALVLGIENGRLIEELARQSKLDVIAVDADASKVAKLRKQLVAAGMYGTRATVLEGDPATYPFPPYIANLIVAKPSTGIDGVILHTLRPYGGTAYLAAAPDRQDELVRSLSSANRPNIRIRKSADFVLVSRDGPLPGADDWSHREANAANAGASQDRFLKAPLGLLWFDGSLRWERKPGSAVVRVANGRVFVLARQRLYAIDAFTGRRMWQETPPLGLSSSLELVADDDQVYFARQQKCLELDAATGATLRAFPFPAGASGNWSNLRVDGKFIVGAIGRHIVCLDRSSGQTLWKYECGRSSLSLAVGDGTVFCAERINTRRGETIENSGAKILAIRSDTGETLWQTIGAGTIRYSTAHKLLVTPTHVLKASDGSRLRNSVAEPQLVGDLLLSGSTDILAVFDMATGDKRGGVLEWFRRGCTGMRSSCHLVTTRYKANAAYMDLETREITPLWNIRPGCNNNLYPADGLLNVPNVTGGCECNYTPTSKAFVPRSELVRREI